MSKGDVIHPGPVYICEKCRALISPNIYTGSVHVHGNTVIQPGECKNFYCDNRVVTSRWYTCPSCDKCIDLPADPEAENLEYPENSRNKTLH